MPSYNCPRIGGSFSLFISVNLISFLINELIIKDELIIILVYLSNFLSLVHQFQCVVASENSRYSCQIHWCLSWGFPLNLVSISWFQLNSEYTYRPRRRSDANIISLVCVYCMVCYNTTNKNTIEIWNYVHIWSSIGKVCCYCGISFLWLFVPILHHNYSYLVQL